MKQLRALDGCGGEGGATAGLQKLGLHVTAVDNDEAALSRNPADERVHGDVLEFVAKWGHTFDLLWMSFPCERWAANGANPAADQWPDLITPGRPLLDATGKPWVMENVPQAPLRRDLLLCGSMFNLTAVDDDGTVLHLRRHRIFESNHLLLSPPSCYPHSRAKQWAGVYGGARSDKHEARTVRHGGYAPKSPRIQSELLGGADWMTAKGRRQSIPSVYASYIGAQLISALAVAA